MSSRQVSPRIPTNSSGFQKATTPELQITSDDEEADIRAKMAEHKWRKVLREEATRLEAERLERERLEAEQCERERMEAEKQEQEQLEAERKEQEWLEAERWEREIQAQQKTGELKGKAWATSTGVVNTILCRQCKKGWVPCTFSHAQQSKRKKRTCDQCTEMKVKCELPEGVEPETEEAGAKAGKKRALEDAMLPRAREKKKVTQTKSGVPSESEAGPLGVVAPATASSDPLVVVVVKGFELIAAAMDRQTAEIRLGDLLGEFEFTLHLSTLLSESSEELHSDMADLELESLQSDHERVGVELDEGIMCRPKDVHMKGRWSDLGNGEEKELWASDGEVFEGDSE
ncbi:hypothetical protein M404DRAFT_34325 [Pisolithus tinctorius Marx 270]|uniref:Uncharacterized protein n=1 Tax=Pisolithus tinctorius Marx 270 TaxID=870435 RepID=A0A0C3N2B0_PISTI|nr:hypothetical protein M404DRAFT_34325 [Pisolithus tinctorius Marx 270]